MNNGYIFGLLDNDLYKFTMQNGVCRLYPNSRVKYSFINRDKREFPDGFAKALQELVDTFRGFRLSKEEVDFLREKCYYLNPAYIDFIKGYQFDPKEVKIEQKGSELFCIIRGLWYRTILWEPPLMALISQLYFEITKQVPLNRDARYKINTEKACSLNRVCSYHDPIHVSDMGTRRRYSFQNHDEVISDFKPFLRNFNTSNVYMAMKHELIPIGTLAHEWIQYHAARYGFRAANKSALDAWTSVYQGNLGIALPDTFTADVFFRTFDTYYAKLFDGLRHDSGNAFKFIEKAINSYRKLKIDTLSKRLIFSNAIDSIKVVKDIHTACEAIINDSYGVGTWFTNDVGVKPLNMVIKMVACTVNGQWVDTIKLSDDEGKYTGKSEVIERCKTELML